MAKAASKKSSTANPQEVKIIVEVQFPQLENQSSTLSFTNESNPGLAGRMTSASLAQVMAVLKIIPVKKIHIVEVDVNAQTIISDTDVEANQPLEQSGAVSPRRPISFRLNITGEPNTRIDVELKFNEQEVFNNALFIPSSGRLIEPKILP